MLKSPAARTITLVLLAAAPAVRAQTPSPSPDPTAALVQATCAACHPVPSPEVLPKSAWKAVVLDMTGLIVQGIGLPNGVRAPSADFDAERIAYWFEQRAPQTLPSPEPWPEVGTGAARFERKALSYPAAKGPAAIANVRLAKLTAVGATEVIAADMLSGAVLAGGEPLKLLGRVPHPCHVEVVDLDKDGRLDLLVADLGAPAPGDETKGSVQWLRARADKTYAAVPLATALPRVADAQAGDFDGDGDLDVVVAAFGWRKAGGILLLENRTTDWAKPAFVPRTLDERTGAIHVPVTDLDGDGKLDFVALLSQHHETVVAFLGDGKGGFRQQTIDAAPHPAWGSSGIQLVDLDGDRDQDVLVTNGDMLDDYQLKPYHGIRWLENKGTFPFVAHDLAPMFGVIRAQAADLDGDTDMDIVAGALVQVSGPAGPVKSPDAPSLVWLEQTAPGVFARHTLERGAQHLSLDLGDVDGDGRVDIVTANSLSGGSGVVEVWRNRGTAR
jgi:hypothetical protein